MAKAMKQTLKKISKCHCIIEVHDARVSSSFKLLIIIIVIIKGSLIILYIPLTGRNPKFQFSQNKKLLVLNKMDLADQMDRVSKVTYYYHIT